VADLTCLTLILLSSFLPLPQRDVKVERIIVHKSKRELVPLRDGQVIKSYRIALGRNPEGAKRRQGDRKTPEGNYKIIGRNPRSAFHR
jgi:murein L,D-transpeptidase YafK